MDYRIGCSGFYYKEWREIFYPKGLAQKDWFSYYAKHFNTIEINSTFYKMPTLKSFEKWYNESPANFLFTLKAPRLITHYKQLRDCTSLLNDFYTTINFGLKEKVGCVLFQFPPKFSYSTERINLLINNLNPNFVNVVEFRHESWWNEEVFLMLKEKQIIFCGQSYPSQLPDQIVKNNPIIYYRFHGKPILYKSEYSATEIANFKQDIPGDTRMAFIYFNNTWGSAALTNSKQLLNLIDH